METTCATPMKETMMSISVEPRSSQMTTPQLPTPELSTAQMTTPQLPTTQVTAAPSMTDASYMQDFKSDSKIGRLLITTESLTLWSKNNANGNIAMKDFVAFLNAKDVDATLTVTSTTVAACQRFMKTLESSKLQTSIINKLIIKGHFNNEDFCKLIDLWTFQHLDLISLTVLDMKLLELLQRLSLKPYLKSVTIDCRAIPGSDYVATIHHVADFYRNTEVTKILTKLTILTSEVCEPATFADLILNLRAVVPKTAVVHMLSTSPVYREMAKDLSTKLDFEYYGKMDFYCFEDFETFEIFKVNELVVGFLSLP